MASLAPIDREHIAQVSPQTRVRAGLLLHAIYLLGTCAWTLFGVRTFQLVTGPKYDVWLVKTVGVLCGAIGATIAAGALRRNPEAEVRALSAATAVSFAAMDVYWVAKGRISAVYLGNAAMQLAILAVWLSPWPRAIARNARRPEMMRRRPRELAHIADTQAGGRCPLGCGTLRACAGASL